MLPIHVRLRVSSQGLQVQRNPHVRAETAEGLRQYVIGSSPDALLQCQAEGVEPLHCVVEVTSRTVSVRDLQSCSGVYVNDARIDDQRLLRDADRIRVGPLELVAEIDDPAEIDQVYEQPSASEEDQQISDWLLRQDESEWRLRRQQPELRRFVIPAPAQEPAAEGLPPAEQSVPDPTASRPKPGRTPSAPAPRADNTERAAEGALRKLGVRTPDVLRGFRDSSSN